MSSAQAVTVAKQAVQLDHAGRAGQALAKYQEAIALIIPLIKDETNPAVRDSLTLKVTGYMDRAEELKRLATAASAPSARRLPAATVATAPAPAPAPAPAAAASAVTGVVMGSLASTADDEALARRLAAEAQSAPAPAAATSQDEDAELARALQEQFNKEASAAQGRAAPRRDGPPVRSTAASRARASANARGHSSHSSSVSSHSRNARSRTPPRHGRSSSSGPRSKTPVDEGRRRGASSGTPHRRNSSAGTSRSTGASATPTRSFLRRGEGKGGKGGATGRSAQRGRGGGGAGGGAGAGTGGGRQRNKKKKDLKLTDMEKKVEESMLVKTPGVSWDDIAGLSRAKHILVEAVIKPKLNPKLYTGIRAPPKGVLLFGPPGTGKTLLAKAVATESKSTFFCVSASALTSKWVGEGEKMVRALFDLAHKMQPSVIFLDEIDSLLTTRRSNENEASRRMKTEFLVRMDGASTKTDDYVLLLAATNRPQELDDALLRRTPKRVYIPLPDAKTRSVLIRHELKGITNTLSDAEFARIVAATQGYSGSDLNNMCSEAASRPLAEIDVSDIRNQTAATVRPINFTDLEEAMKGIRASVSADSLKAYEDWMKEYGVKG